MFINDKQSRGAISFVVNKVPLWGEITGCYVEFVCLQMRFQKHFVFVFKFRGLKNVNFLISILKQNFTHGTKVVLGQAASGPRTVYCAGIV
jgi:hypothetical protein